MRVVALAGGTGSAKLLRGLAGLPISLSVVCNVGDNFHWQGLLVCPDLDIVLYTLAGIADEAKGWGVRGDTFQVLAQLRPPKAETWFRVGDRDLTTSLFRADCLRRGMTLTTATEEIGRKYGIASSILPVTDDPLETYLTAPEGSLHLQEFWVRDAGKPPVSRVTYKGSEAARLTPKVEKAIRQADRIVVCPANPVTSIRPMLAVKGLLELLAEAPGRVSAVSPMKGRFPFSGPAGKLMEASGIRPDSVGVAQLYSRFLDALIVDIADRSLAPEVEALGVRCRLSDTEMDSPEDCRRLASEVLEA